MTHAEKAAELFSKKFNCSQSVFASFSDDLGIPEKIALKTGACFGSGMRKGEVCGACITEYITDYPALIPENYDPEDDLHFNLWLQKAFVIS